MSHANVQWGLDRHTNTPILQSPNPNRMLPLPPCHRPFLPHMLPAPPPSLSHRLLPTCAAIHKFASFDLRRGPQQLCGSRHGGAPPPAAAPMDHHHLHYWPPRSGHCRRISQARHKRREGKGGGVVPCLSQPGATTNAASHARGRVVL
jgi:hypothetical protein